MPAAPQLSLLDEPSRSLPNGFEYRPGLVTSGEEVELIERFQALDFKPFEFHGYFGNRRVVSFGWHYDFAASRVRRGGGFPDLLMALCVRAASFPGSGASAVAPRPLARYNPRGV